MNKLLQVARNLKALTQMVFSRQGAGWFLFPNSRRNYARKTDMLSANVVMAPVLWIARSFTEAVLSIVDDGEYTREHEMIALIRRPNEHYSGVLLWLATVISFLIDGNAYWIILRNAQRKPVELWYVPHWLITPYTENATDFIQYYRYTPGGREIKLDPEDVVHFRYGLDPDNPRKGLAPLKPALREVFTDEEAANYTASMLSNGGVPGLIISPAGDGTIQQSDADATKKYVQEKFSGDSRGEPMVMPTATKVEQFGYDPGKMNLSSIRNVSEERVTALLGVPAAIVGFGTGLEQATQNATMSTLRRIAYESAVIPLQHLAAEELQIQLLPEFEPKPDSVDVAFDTSGVRVLQEDQNELWKRLDIAIQGGWLTVSDAQAAAGLEVDESQRVYLRRMAVMQVSAGRSSQGKATNDRWLKMQKISRDAAQALSSRLMRDWDMLSDAFEGELEGRFEDYGRKAAEAYQEVTEDRGLTRSGNGQRKDITDPEDAVVTDLVIRKLNETADTTAVLAYGPHYLRVAEATVGSINAVLEVGLNLSDPMEKVLIEAGGKRMGLVDLSGQTKRELLDTLAAAREQGYGGEKLAREIRDRVSAGPWKDAKTRSRVIARTETKYAQNQSSVQVGRESGATAMRVVDAQIGNTDEFCEWINGQTVSVSDAEQLASTEHPNGTRSFIPLFESDVEPVASSQLVE